MDGEEKQDEMVLTELTLQHGGNEDLNNKASDTGTYLELSSACQTGLVLVRFPIVSYWFVSTFFIYFSLLFFTSTQLLLLSIRSSPPSPSRSAA